MTNSNLGRDGIIWITNCSVLEKTKKDPKQRPQKNTAYRLVPHGLFSRAPSPLNDLIFGMKFKIIFRVDKLYVHVFAYVIEMTFMGFY